MFGSVYHSGRTNRGYGVFIRLYVSDWRTLLLNQHCYKAKGLKRVGAEYSGRKHEFERACVYAGMKLSIEDMKIGVVYALYYMFGNVYYMEFNVQIYFQDNAGNRTMDYIFHFIQNSTKWSLRIGKSSLAVLANEVSVIPLRLMIYQRKILRKNVCPSVGFHESFVEIHSYESAVVSDLNLESNLQ